MYMFKSIIFDIGGTLVGYDKPLNWSNLYRPAMEYVAQKCKLNFTENDYHNVTNILTKYNTRINPRIHEVSSAQIFKEITYALNLPTQSIDDIKHHFFSFFRRNSFIYPEVEDTLRALSKKGIKMGTLSDVAYGMDNKYALEDIDILRKYIAYPLTSNDVVFRKPCTIGLELLCQKMNTKISETVVIGDEKKDILCANDAGAYSILINRDGKTKKYNQAKEISSIYELLLLFMV